jgi:glycosyltransferase involved in cell wall biosynthesis
MEKPFLVWLGAATDPSGYGEATRNYLLGMDDIGDFDIKLVNRSFWHGSKLDLRNIVGRLDEMSQRGIPNDVDEQSVTLFNLTPENYFLPKGFKNVVGMTTFETDSIPHAWGMYMRAMDAIITYSDFNRQTFSDFGINRPIIVVPHGVDSERFSPEVKPLDSMTELREKYFVFGSNFDWNTRKNPEGLIKAYFNAFINKDDVVLVLKVYHQHPIARSVETIKRKIFEIKEEFKGRTDLPRIILFTDIIRPEDMAAFYTSIDCYVLASRGEGWSLTHSEAMAAGLPTIGTGWSGNTEFMNADNSYLVDFKIEKIKDSEVEHQPHYKGQSWAVPDIKHMTEVMRHIYDHQDEAKAKGALAREDMVQNWSWKVACEKLNEELLNISGGSLR